MNRDPEAGSWVTSALALAIRPWLWRTAWRWHPTKPWRISSWSGLGPYVRFRMETAYGDKHAQPTAAESVQFLSWARRSK